MDSKYYTDLEEYIKQKEPEKAEKSSIWQTAIGLQDVDNLKTSDYLLETVNIPKCKNCTLDCTLEEMAVLKNILANNKITQKELAKIINKSERTVKTITVELQNKGFLTRENGKRNGTWKVLVDL